MSESVDDDVRERQRIQRHTLARNKRPERTVHLGSATSVPTMSSSMCEALANADSRSLLSARRSSLVLMVKKLLSCNGCIGITGTLVHRYAQCLTAYWYSALERQASIDGTTTTTANKLQRARSHRGVPSNVAYISGTGSAGIERVLQGSFSMVHFLSNRSESSMSPSVASELSSPVRTRTFFLLSDESGSRSTQSINRVSSSIPNRSR